MTPTRSPIPSRVHAAVWLWLVGGLAVLALSAQAAEQPLPEPEQVGDVKILTGGVGDAAQQAIREQADGYSFWLTLTGRDGVYLADVQVRIENEKGEEVLETTTEGPFLLADLPPGRYAVRAMADGRRAERRTLDTSEKGQSRMFVTLEKR